MNLRDFKSVKERREALEKEMAVSFKNSGHFSLDESVAATRNCENMIGVTQIPLGIAGPLKVLSSKFKALSCYIPLATTEGALVASVSRGCKAISESGGAIVSSYHIGTTRGPVFEVSGLLESDRLQAFLETHFANLQTIAGQTSTHLKLTRFFSHSVGKQCFVRFVFDTQDAMGMNMVTIATTKLVEFIEAKTGARCISVAGNFDVDKKPAWLNVIEGRGTKVRAEVTISEKTLQTVLKTTAYAMHKVWLDKCMIGSAISGSMAFNAQFANIIAALLTATGQDLGHIGEGSLGITTTEVVSSKFEVRSSKHQEHDLYISVYLPDLMVGTVGGGTGLATQQEALKLLDVVGGDKGNNALKFAEIIAAAVLAGEISLLASLSEGTLAKAHQKLGRGGK